MSVPGYCSRECTDCPNSGGTCDYDKGSTDASVMVIFDYPTGLNASKEDIWISDQGSLVKQCLEAVGVDMDDVYATFAVNCPLKHDTKDAAKKKAMLACRSRLLAEVRAVNPDKVLCLGTISFSCLRGAERLLPITKVRGRWHKSTGTNILGTVSPALVLKATDFYRDFIFDLEKFATSCGRRPYPEVDVTVADTYPQLVKEINRLLKSDVIACDVETTGFSPVDCDLLAVGFGVCDPETLKGHCLVIAEDLLANKRVWQQINKVLKSKVPTAFHNAKFDLQFLRRGLEEQGLEYAPVEIDDTMLLHYVIDERPMGAFGSHALKVLAEQWEDAPAYDIHMGPWISEYLSKLRQGEDVSEMLAGMHQYLALDCYYTARLYYSFTQYIADNPDDFNPKVGHLYSQILVPGQMALADVEKKGVLCDKEFFEDLADTLHKREMKAQGRLQKLTGVPDFNPGSPKQVQQVLYEDLKLPKLTSSRRGKQIGGATSQEVLSKLKRTLRAKPGNYKKELEIIDLILEYRKLSKTKGTYAIGVLDRLDSDGRLRGTFNVHGTVTGRLSSSNPNLQNIPDSSHTGIEVRNGFIAPEGKVLIEADYSQLELRVAAFLSGCPDFKEVFIEHRDVHQEVTWSLFKKEKSEATKYERYMAKCMNFGVMYQRGASSLANGPEMDYIEDSGGTRWSEKEVKAFFDKMLDAWPGFRQWIEDQQVNVYKDQYVDTPLGRRRRFPLILSKQRDRGATGRQAVNTPIQGTASDFTVWALCHINSKLPEGAHIVSTVHDSILIEVPEDKVEEVLELVKTEMEVNTPLDVDLPFKADADVAMRWGEMGKYEWNQDELTLTPVAEDA